MSQDSHFSSEPLSDIMIEDITNHLFEDVDQTFGKTFLENAHIFTDNGQLMLQNDNTLTYEDIKTEVFRETVPSNILPIPLNDTLSNLEYVTDYNFEVTVIPNLKCKNPWVYSPKLHKVFMEVNQQFPVTFAVTNPEDDALFIRATPQYTSENHSKEPVRRCYQHDHVTDSMNSGVDEHVRKHVIRCENSHAKYIGNIDDRQHLSVVIPLKKPQAGSDVVWELFKFVCKGSCTSPGMNRREIEIIFTLETWDGIVVGRKALKVRVCACPKRDKEKEEKDVEKSNVPVPKSKKRKIDHSHGVNGGKIIAHGSGHMRLNLEIYSKKETLLEVLKYAEKCMELNVLKDNSDDPSDKAEVVKSLQGIQEMIKNLS